MADFSQAVAKTELWEGGYSNNPNDSGGETYRGISRKNWPSWSGWQVIDQHKTESDFPANLDQDSVLQGLIVDFYHKNFWNYDGLNDQDVANKVFDLGVNVGKTHAVKILQTTVGAVVDGIYGEATENLSNHHPKGSLSTLIRAAAEDYYKKLVILHPEDSIFLKGWLARAEA
jgi:lysozyme family protein